MFEYADVCLSITAFSGMQNLFKRTQMVSRDLKEAHMFSVNFVLSAVM